MLTPVKYVAAMNLETLPENTDRDFAFKYVDISAVSSEGHIDIPKTAITFGAAPSRARRIASPGSVLVSTVRTYLRAVAAVPRTDDNLIYSTGFAVLTPRRGTDSRYLAYACRSDRFVEEVVAQSTGVSYPAINPSELGQIPIPIPPCEEQRRIADFLDDQVTRIDNVIAAREKQSRLALDVAQAATALETTQLAAAHGLIPLRRAVIDTKTGSTPSPDLDQPGGLPWYSPASFVANGTLGNPVRFIDHRAGQSDGVVRFPPGSVLLVGIGATAGRVAVLDRPGAGNQQLTALVPNPSIDGRFLYRQLEARSSELLGTASFTVADYR